MMRQTIRHSGILATVLLLIAVAAPVSAQEFRTRLSGYEEVPLTINTTGSGTFSARVVGGGTAIDYELTYRDLSSPVTQAHIHFGRPAIAGMIVLFLCTNLTPPDGVPTPQACPAAPATISGRLTAVDVIARPAQGIDGGAAGFAEIIAALRAGAAYANVHTETFPPGEIRGGLGHSHSENEQ